MKFNRGSRTNLLLCFSVLITFGEIENISGAKILVPFFVGSKSHRNAIDPLLVELANKGHQVTIISAFQPTKEVKNLRQLTTPTANSQKKMVPNLFEEKLSNRNVQVFDLAALFRSICTSYYEMPEMKEILSESFDLLIMNAFVNECTFGLVHHFNIPFIFFSSQPIPSWISPSFGLPTLPSFHPYFMNNFADEMTIFERMENLYDHTKAYLVRNYIYNPKMEAIYQRYFPNAPSVNEIEKNASLVLSNTHVALNYPKPILPDVIEIGGLICGSTNPLPKDIQDFLDGSGEHGFIYFSMGSFIETSSLPEYLRLHIIKAFAKLKQKVIWKWETETMDDLPSNVKLAKWLPQKEILKHPNIKIFITHGGILGLQESSCYGVPLLGIPMYTDQFGNLETFRRKGIALILELSDITEESLTKSITTILSDDKFHKNSKELSIKFLDNHESPLEKAVFWTEFVIRNKGAVHLRSPARNLNFMQYHSIDTLLIFASILAAFFYLVFKLIRIIFHCFAPKQRNQSNKPGGKVLKRD